MNLEFKKKEDFVPTSSSGTQSIDAILHNGTEIGWINSYETEDGTKYQATLLLDSRESDLVFLVRERVYGYGRTREEAIDNVFFKTRKEQAAILLHLTLLEEKIKGAQNNEQQEEPNTTGRILS